MKPREPEGLLVAERKGLFGGGLLLGAVETVHTGFVRLGMRRPVKNEGVDVVVQLEQRVREADEAFLEGSEAEERVFHEGIPGSVGCFRHELPPDGDDFVRFRASSGSLRRADLLQVAGDLLVGEGNVDRCSEYVEPLLTPQDTETLLQQAASNRHPTGGQTKLAHLVVQLGKLDGSTVANV